MPAEGLVLFYGNGDYKSHMARMILEEKNVGYTLKRISVLDGDNYRSDIGASALYQGIVPCVHDPIKEVHVAGEKNIVNHLDNHYVSDDNPRLMVPESSKHAALQEDYIKTLDKIPMQLLAYAAITRVGLVADSGMSDTEKGKLLSCMTNLKNWMESWNEGSDSALLSLLKAETDAEGDVHDPSKVKEALRCMIECIQYFDEELAGEGHELWLVGENFTFCDIYFTVILQRLKHLGYFGFIFSDERFPRVRAYFQRVQLRESFLKTFEVDDFEEEMKVIRTQAIMLAILIFGIVCIVLAVLTYVRLY